MHELSLKYYVYCLYPIDNGWGELHALDGPLPASIAQVAKELGWEGDVRGDYIGWLPFPHEEGFHPCFVWKQDNNGDTFVAAPALLSWDHYEPTCGPQEVMVHYEELGKAVKWRGGTPRAR